MINFTVFYLTKESQLMKFNLISAIAMTCALSVAACEKKAEEKTQEEVKTEETQAPATTEAPAEQAPVTPEATVEQAPAEAAVEPKTEETK